MEKIIQSFQYGENTLTLETGRIARQASGSVLASLGETVLLATVVGDQRAEPASFLPLTVDLEEKTYAAGKIPGGFFKREGRPSENAILTARLIDRPLRPLFPKGFYYPVQVVINVMSLDPEINPDILALIASSAALQISGIPQNGVMGAARVGYIDGQYILNPSKTQLDASSLDLVVAGTDNAVLMVESEAKILSEEEMLGAVVYGHDQAKLAIKEIKEFASKVSGIVPWDFQVVEEDPIFVDAIKMQILNGLTAAYTVVDKVQRKLAIQQVRETLIANLSNEPDPSVIDRAMNVLQKVEKEIVRSRVIEGHPRIDGRDTKTVRPIAIETSILPRTHGSALFTRGETQAIVITTLGSDRDAQLIDSISGERRESFMMHYNFPPYCVGEVGRVGSPKRREIGHGNLARRSVNAILPDDYPYVLRVVSEITESNGSSSMASVCGASLSLMDAGVPIKAPVAGVAMGLIKEGEKFSVLTDILGDEDHLGDMDFKVAGTKEGVTALQMDIKIEGITREIMEIALEQAKQGRLHILGEMEKVISTSRSEISQYAPRIETMKIHTDKIRDVIGKGGATIRAITEETGVSINIEDDGTINIVSVDKAASDLAKKRIEDITADVEVGRVYNGKVVKIMDFGAFVAVMPGKEGLVHISQLSQERVEKVGDVVKEGQEVKVKVLEIDKQGKIRLSMKAVDE